MRANTQPDVQRRLDRETEERVGRLANEDRWVIERRIGQLEQESDIERLLEINASSLVLAGVALSIFNRRWLILPAVVSGFLLQHGVQGWCPPVPLFRRAGVRTRQEIEAERHALEALVRRR